MTVLYMCMHMCMCMCMHMRASRDCTSCRALLADPIVGQQETRQSHLLSDSNRRNVQQQAHAADMAYAASVDAMFPAPVHVPSAAVRAPRSGFRRAQMIASAPNLIKRTVLGSAQIDAPKETAWRRASAANRDVLGPKIVRELES